MIYRTTSSKIKAYFEDTNSVSQSELKLLLKGYDHYIKEKNKEQSLYYEEDNSSFKIGSAVDCLITEGTEVFNEKFYISSLNALPSDAIISIVKNVFDKIVSDTEENEEVVFEPLEYYESLIIDACVNANYRSTYGNPAKIKLIKEHGSDYWSELIYSKDKTILTVQQFETVQNVINSIKNHETGRKLFDDYHEANSDVDVFFQLPLFEIIEGVSIKGLIDVVMYNKVTGELSLLDIKTTYDSVSNFHYTARKYRYDIQATTYITLFERAISSLSDLYNLYNSHPNGDTTYFISKRFKFLVQSTNYTDNKASVLTLSKNALKLAYSGRPPVTVPGLTPVGNTTEIDFPAFVGLSKLLSMYSKIKANNHYNKPYLNFDLSGIY